MLSPLLQDRDGSVIDGLGEHVLHLCSDSVINLPLRWEVQRETWCTCRSPMVAVASGHRVNAQRHQGNKESHLQWPS